MPIVTISRQFGSGGSDVAARVASALGWSLLDNALVEAVSQRLGTSAAEVEAREERVPSLVERLAEAMTLGSPEMMPALLHHPLPPSEEQLLDVTRRVILEAAARGPVVLVGRGAQSFLAAREDAIHVLCYAPPPALAARVAAREGLAPDEARRRVEDTNRQREQYVRRYWNRSWLAHENYHLCLNTEWLGIDGAAALVVDTARRR